jgi:FkbM family methyltransferase
VLTNIAKRLLAFTPYRISRSPPNRFQEIEHCLGHLRRLGYEPRQIVDAGAHLGVFSLAAMALFPAATIHMIEPQPACSGVLTSLAAEHGFVFHPYALSAEPGTVRMVCSDKADTGAHIAWADDMSKANTMWKRERNDLLLANIDLADRTLLKLDLQGHELLALSGASRILPFVEVIVAEVSFFQPLGEARIPKLVNLLDEAAFDLFDIAALAGRTRDDRLREGDFVFAHRGSKLWIDKAWD